MPSLGFSLGGPLGADPPKPAPGVVSVVFSLKTITVLSTTSIRVTFTENVLALNPLGVHDAQNPLNYTFVGPSNYKINSVLPIPSDPTSVEVVFRTPLSNGQWAVFVSNITSADSLPLSSPTNLFFSVQSANIIPAASGGTTNDTAYDVLRKHLNPAFQGPGWTSLLKGISKGLSYLQKVNEFAFQQSFINTAVGSGLTALAASDGITKFPNSGISDDLFRQLAIQVTNGKLTENAYLQVLKIFFGIDSVQASATSTNTEPFALVDGYTLQFNIDNRYNAVITFNTNSFANIGAAKAQEIASVITQELENQSIPAFADVFIDPNTGLKKVQVYSNALGLLSSVTVTGGFAQNILQFPSKIANLQTSDSVAVFSVDSTNVNAPSAGYIRYWLQPNSGLTPETILTNVRIGDYVVVQNGPFPNSVQGTYPIAKVTYNSATSVYVDVLSTSVVALNTTSITGNTQFQIYRPVKNTTITSSNRNVIVSRIGQKEIDVIIPATSQIVNRNESTAAYLQDFTTINASVLERFGNTIYVDTTTPHNLSVGDQVLLTDFTPKYTRQTNSPYWPLNYTTPPTLTAGNTTTKTDQHPLPIVSYNTTRTCVATWWGTNTLLQNGNILVAGGGVSTVSATNTAQVFQPGSLITGARLGNALNYSWGSTSTLNHARQGHAATLLNNGKVLITGGWSAGYLTTCELYDPSGNTWSNAASMAHARALHTSTLLNDGRVLVTGGADGTSNQTATCEIYNPTTDAWTTVTSLKYARVNHKAILLNSGKVLIDGGRVFQDVWIPNTGSTGYIKQTEIFDPLLNTSTIVDSASKAVFGHPICLLPNGNVFALHGGKGQTNTAQDDFTNYFEIFDVTLNRWTQTQGPYILHAFNGFTDSGTSSNNQLAVYIPSKNVVLTCFTSGSFALYYDLNTNTFHYISVANAIQTPSIFNPASFFVNGVCFVFGASNKDDPTKTIIYMDGYHRFSSGQYNDVVETVTSVTSPTTFSVNIAEPLPDSYMVSFNGTVIPLKAQIGKWAGPFIANPQEGPVITSVHSSLSNNISSGTGLKTISVADGSSFPDEDGFLCIGLGYSYQTGPVPYFGKQDTNTLIIGFEYTFPFDIPNGADVSLLAYKGGFVAVPPEYGAFWLTASAVGRLSAIQTIQNIAASGGITNITVEYPNDFGLGGSGYPTFDAAKLSDLVEIYAGDDVDNEVALAEIGELP